MISSLFSRPVALMALCGPLLLGACGYSLGSNSLGECPKVGVLQDVAQLAVQRGGPDSNVEAVVTIAAGSGQCTYDSSGRNDGRPTKVTFDLTLTTRAARNGNSSLGSTKAPYFVAIFSPNNKLLTTKNGTIDISLSDEPKVETETFSVTLPIPPDMDSAIGFRVTAGFRLTPQQLADNRQRLGF